MMKKVIIAPVRAALRLFRLVGSLCNLHALADILKLGCLGAGFSLGFVMGGRFFLPVGEKRTAVFLIENSCSFCK